LFTKYGKLEEAKLPKDKEGKFKGYAFITYSMPEEAMRAFAELDNKVIFGRILHLRPSYEQKVVEKI
jgi:multiple RNA-binding domain-containing protein 1